METPHYLIQVDPLNLFLVALRNKKSPRSWRRARVLRMGGSGRGHWLDSDAKPNAVAGLESAAVRASQRSASAGVTLADWTNSLSASCAASVCPRRAK